MSFAVFSQHLLRHLPKATRAVLALGLGFALTLGAGASAAANKSAAQLSSESNAALQQLYARTPAAKALGAKAEAILVFPSITKAGLMVGGQYGEGALLKGGKTVAYYNTAGASYGLQAGAQRFGYAMFLMNANAVAALNSADGFEVGVGPSVVVIDEGKAKQLTTTTMKDDIYSFVFSQKGLMAGVGLQGNKITRIQPK